MLLDAVLADRHHGWLGTEQDTRTYYREALERDLADDWYPHLTFGDGAEKTMRFFPEKRPIGVPLKGDRRHVLSTSRPAMCPPRFACSIAACGPAQVGRRMDHSRPPAMAISQGRSCLSLRCSRRVPDGIYPRANRSDLCARLSPGSEEPYENGLVLLIPQKLVLTKERPHQTRGVNAAAGGPDDPCRHRLAARPGMASSLDRVEHHHHGVRTIPG